MVRCHHNVIRAYIPVDQPRPVHLFQGFHNRLHQFQCLGRPYVPFMPVQDLLQGLAFHKFHNDISRLIFLETVLYLHNARKAPKFCQALGFLQKLPLFTPENRPLLPGGCLQAIADSNVPGNQFAHVKFFNRCFFPPVQVIPYICDPEPAFPDYPAHQVFSGQNGFRGKIIGVGPVLSLLEAAMGAWPQTLFFLHAPHT